MKFDFAIGNPPYQDEIVGEQKNYAAPVYNLFLDAAYSVADKTEMIHPARFLFNAGSTPKVWNEKMLNDEHLKIIHYEANSEKIFSNTDITGGIAITYHDTQKSYGAIEVFSGFSELNSIRKKVCVAGLESLSKIIANRGLYRFSNKAYDELPDEMAKNTDSRIGSSSFTRMSIMFLEDKPKDEYEYIQIYGLLGKERVYRWIKKDYVKLVDAFFKYNVFIPKANGSGAIGEVPETSVIGQPVIGNPFIAHTETFLSIGSFDTEFEAVSCLKYVESKFARTMLGILKITQDNTSEKWHFVPLQDFTSESDIDWTRSVSEIDRQLYKKYDLSPEEIDFIESHVKEME